MDISSHTFEEIKKGYHFNPQENAYVCNYCHKMFPKDQVFSINDSFFIAEAAAGKHIRLEHGGSFSQLLGTDTKYNTLTEKQKELLQLFQAGLSDHEIAKKTGVTASTIRHQKFTFREKAKQARFYLALYEQVFEDEPDNDETIIPIHDHAVYYDQRYVITEQEKNKVLDASFISLQPLKLKIFPRKEKKKVAVLMKIAECFDNGKEYTEPEVNQILKAIYDDHTTLRRYLVMYGFMERHPDGSVYRRT